MSWLSRILICSLLSSASAEVVTLVANNRGGNSSQPTYSRETITLKEGETARANYVSNVAFIDVTVGNILVRIDANNTEQTNLPFLTGPAVIRISNFTSSNAALATFTINRNGEKASQSVSPQAVVIPADGKGEHEVTLESSRDLVTWTPTEPGTFSHGNASRFFRVRVSQK